MVPSCVYGHRLGVCASERGRERQQRDRENVRESGRELRTHVCVRARACINTQTHTHTHTHTHTNTHERERERAEDTRHTHTYTHR